jgi:hypothetical protein
LAKICSEIANHDAWVRDVKDGELSDAVWVQECNAPSDGRAPIVAGEENAVLAKLIGDGEDIGDEMWNGVGGCAPRLAAFVVATLIGNYDSETGNCEGLDLIAPGIPEFGEAVQEDDDWTIGWACGDGVEVDSPVVERE